MYPLLSTDSINLFGVSSTGDPRLSRQEEKRKLEPIEDLHRVTTWAQGDELLETIALKRTFSERKFYSPPVAKRVLPSDVRVSSTPLQVWEGTVLEVDFEKQSMEVLLTPTMGKGSRHTGEIELEWVSQQDLDLVAPGAVFYLTLFKRSLPSVENAQELRFRRMPAWSAAQIKKIKEAAAALESKIKDLPLAE